MCLSCSLGANHVFPYTSVHAAVGVIVKCFLICIQNVNKLTKYFEKQCYY